MTDPVTVIQTASDTVNILSTLFDAITNFMPKLVAIASVMAAITPPPDPASKWYPILKPFDTIINYIAFNVKHAQNKTHD